MPARQADRELDLDEGRRGGLHRTRQNRAPLRCRGGGDGFRRAGPGRHLRAQDGNLRARLQDPDRAGRLPAAKTSSSTPISSPSPPAWRSTTTTASISSRRRPGSARTCLTRTCPAACRTCPSRSAATNVCARRCTRCSSITPSRRAWTWASSMRGRWPSMTTSILSCARPAKTWCSTAGRTRPSACWHSPTSSAVPAMRPRRSISPGATSRSSSG